MTEHTDRRDAFAEDVLQAVEAAMANKVRVAGRIENKLEVMLDDGQTYTIVVCAKRTPSRQYR